MDSKAMESFCGVLIWLATTGMLALQNERVWTQLYAVS
jgi:hypothetical protein